jgi:hypothetical protein
MAGDRRLWAIRLKLDISCSPGIKAAARPVDNRGMPDKIEELVDRLRKIEEQLAVIMASLPEPSPATEQTAAEGAIDLTLPLDEPERAGTTPQ